MLNGGDIDFGAIYWRDAFRVHRAGAVHLVGPIEPAQHRSMLAGADAAHLHPIVADMATARSRAEWTRQLGTALGIPDPSDSTDWLTEWLGDLAWLDGDAGLMVVQVGLDTMAEHDPDGLSMVGEICAESIVRQTQGVLYEDIDGWRSGRVIHWVIVADEACRRGIQTGVELHNRQVLECAPDRNWHWWRTLAGGENDPRWTHWEDVPDDQYIVHASPHAIMVPIAIHPTERLAGPDW